MTLQKNGIDHCKTGTGMLDRLENLMFNEHSVLYLKCKNCNENLMASDWFNGKSFKELLLYMPKCENCGKEFI